MSAWLPIATAPMDGTHILILTNDYGAVEAWFAEGEWSSGTPESPREYSGPVWVCADDKFQCEIEEIPPEHGGLHHGTVTHWMPLPEPPK